MHEASAKHRVLSAKSAFRPYCIRCLWIALAAMVIGVAVVAQSDLADRSNVGTAFILVMLLCIGSHVGVIRFHRPAFARRVLLSGETLRFESDGDWRQVRLVDIIDAVDRSTFMFKTNVWYVRVSYLVQPGKVDFLDFQPDEALRRDNGGISEVCALIRRAIDRARSQQLT